MPVNIVVTSTFISVTPSLAKRGFAAQRERERDTERERETETETKTGTETETDSLIV